MPSTPHTKKVLPTQALTAISKKDKIFITLDTADSDKSMAKRKEEAGKPLYLKRV